VLARLKALPERWAWLGFLLAIQKRYGEVNGGNVASAVTLSAFLSLFPLVLVATAVIGFIAGDQPDLADDLVEALGIPPDSDAATAVTAAVTTAANSKAAASIIGVAGLLWTGLGLVAALQYAHNTVWQATGRGFKDKALGILWLAGAAVLFIGTIAVTTVVQFLPGPVAPVNLVVGIVLNTLLFLWAAKVLTNVDVGWRALLPGAIAAGISFELLKIIGGIYVPRLVASSSAIYGSIGVVFAIIAWLFFFGRLIVYSIVVNVMLWERMHGTVQLEIEVPKIPGREGAEGVTRGGDVVAEPATDQDDQARQAAAANPGRP
jgi:membrane protein